MGTGAGGNCPPHFEKLAKLINPFLALTLWEKLFYFSMEADNVQLAKSIMIRYALKLLVEDQLSPSTNYRQLARYSRAHANFLAIFRRRQ